MTMKPDETATGFGSDQEREENPEQVIAAHKRVQAFIEQQIATTTFPDYQPLGLATWKKLCALKNDIVFASPPERMANGYPNLEEYGQRVSQWIWDKHSFIGKDNQRQLNAAGKLLINFLNTELGIVAQPTKKSREELRVEQTMTDIHAEIRHRVKKGQITSPDSDAVMDEIKQTAEEDRKYERELYGWLRKLTIDVKPGNSIETLKKSIPAEFTTDLNYLLQQNAAGHLSFEELEELIPKRRLEWRREQIIMKLKRAETMDEEAGTPHEGKKIITITDSSDSESEQKLKEEVLESLDRGEFPIMQMKLEPIKDYKKLEPGIKKAYAKKLKTAESELFVEDASNISETLTTETRFLQDLFKTEYQGSPIPLRDMIPNDAPLQMIRITAKKQKGENQTIWATVSLEGKNTVVKTFHGKVFSPQEIPKINLIPLESPTVEPILKKSGVSDSGRFKRQVEKTIHQPSKNIDIVASEQGPIARVTIEKDGQTSYEWYDLGPMVEAA